MRRTAQDRTLTGCISIPVEKEHSREQARLLYLSIATVLVA